jgi:16S rRNA C967 or C1407 C5-methylase (RsmB/RsmF family)
MDDNQLIPIPLPIDLELKVRETARQEARAMLKDVLKEAFEEFLGEKGTKEILAMQEQKKIDKAKAKEWARWEEELKAELELNQHNPQINTKEAALILGVSVSAVYLYVKKGWLKGEGSSMGWVFRKNETAALKPLLPQLRKDGMAWKAKSKLKKKARQRL